jgi:uncharacterized membrane protein
MKADFSVLDVVALTIFVACWFGYGFLSNALAKKRASLLTVLNPVREHWMHEALGRENRILDSTLVANLMQSATFFSSTTVLIMGGLVAGLGGLDKNAAMVGSLPFAAKASIALMEIKLLTLIALFMYAFVKFSWSVRQFNFTSILIGAMPAHSIKSPASDTYAKRAAKLSALASENFTLGLRAYYFALPALLWFMNPILFIVGVIVLVFMLYRMEFHSRTLDALTHE